jgi:sulfite exporter TauE/SafE
MALPMAGDLAVLFIASVLGSAHCVGMCGPYVAMCTAQFLPRGASAASRLGLRLLFNLGRVATYCVIGLVAGAFGQIFLAAAARWGGSGIVAIAAGCAALYLGLSLIGWVPDPLRLMTHVGLDSWISAGRSRLSGLSPALAPLLLGSLQGLLPCALVYAAASRAAVAGSASAGALTMLIFGLGTIPVIFALTVVPQSVLRRLRAQRLAGALIAALGVLLILRGLASFGLVPVTYWW